MSITGRKAIAAASVSDSDAVGEALGSGSPKSTRWEHVVGKALKDWATEIMLTDGITRDAARLIILKQIQAVTAGIKDGRTSDGRTTESSDTIAM